MLALSDEALAHLAIAATAVAPDERGAWLAAHGREARKWWRCPHHFAARNRWGYLYQFASPVASRQRPAGAPARARGKGRDLPDGGDHQADLAAAAIAAGVLDGRRALDRAELRGVVEELVRKWCREWLDGGARG